MPWAGPRTPAGSSKRDLLPINTSMDGVPPPRPTRGFVPRRLPEPVVRALGIFAAIVGAGYLGWRVGWTLNTDALWLALPLWLAEFHGYVVFLLYFMLTWDVRPRQRGTVPSATTVDFFIPTYNEPYEVVALTIAGAKAVRWPHETYVLDDGRRPWLRDLCARHGVHYVTRPGNAGAKAGNINHALGISHGEFIALVDADHVPSEDFIDEMIGYFADRRVALVQGPQEYYNLDSFQHLSDGTDWHEQSVFYRVIQPGKARSNSVFWCGTPSMFRRSAMEEIGGVATDTITEDLHTSLILHSAGWKIAYHNSTVARGIAPEDYNAFIIQRVRWAQGAMQVLRREFARSHISPLQRLSYLASTTTYFDSYRKLVLLMIIPVILLTDRYPIHAPLGIYVAVWFAQFVVVQSANVALGRGYYRWVATEMFDLMKMFAFIRASFALLADRRLRFKVTPKAQGARRRLDPLITPHLTLIGVYLVAAAAGGLRFAHVLPAPAVPLALVSALCWAAVVGSALGALTWRTYAHSTKRGPYRLSIQREARVHFQAVSAHAEIVDLSVLGAGIVTPVQVPVGERLTIVGSDGVLIGLAVVRFVEPAGASYRVGVQFVDSDADRWERAAWLARALVGAHPLDAAAGQPSSAHIEGTGDSERGTTPVTRRAA